MHKKHESIIYAGIARNVDMPLKKSRNDLFTSPTCLTDTHIIPLFFDRDMYNKKRQSFSIAGVYKDSSQICRNMHDISPVNW